MKQEPIRDALAVLQSSLCSSLGGGRSPVVVELRLTSTPRRLKFRRASVETAVH